MLPGLGLPSPTVTEVPPVPWERQWDLVQPGAGRGLWEGLPILCCVLRAAVFGAWGGGSLSFSICEVEKGTHRECPGGTERSQVEGAALSPPCGGDLGRLAVRRGWRAAVALSSPRVCASSGATQATHFWGS